MEQMCVFGEECETMMAKIQQLFQTDIRVDDLKNGWFAVYEYLLHNTVEQTRSHFGDGIIEMIKRYY